MHAQPHPTGLRRARKGSIVLLVSPSGAGKTTLSVAVRKRLAATGGEFAKVVTHTTREPRTGEQEGVHYHFVSTEQFRTLEAAGAFVETAFVHGRPYGTSKAAISKILDAGRDAMLVIDVQGAAAIKAQFPDAIYVFILPPSVSALRERLKMRGQDDELEIARRLAESTNEIRRWKEADYVLVNDDLATATEELFAIVSSHHLKSRKEDHAELVTRLLARY